MAKLPQFQQQQRISAGSAQLVNPSDARKMYDEQAGLGKDIMQFGGAVATYEQKAAQIQDAADLKSMTDELEIKGLQIKSDIESNKDGDIAPDGRNIISTYNNKFEELKGGINGISDARTRQLGLQALGKVRSKYAGSISSLEVASRAMATLQNVDKANRVAAHVVATDPSQRQAKIEEQRQFIMSQGLSPENTMKAFKNSEDMINGASIDSIRDNPRKLRAALNGELATAYTTEEKNAMLEKAQSLEASAETATMRKINLAESVAKYNADMKAKKARTDVDDLLLSDNPKDKMRGIELAKEHRKTGVFTPEQFNNVLKSKDEFDYVDSARSTAIHLARAERGERPGTYIQDILNDPTLEPQSRNMLLNKYSEMVDNSIKDPAMTSKKAIAKAIKDAAFPKEQLTGYLKDKKLEALSIRVEIANAKFLAAGKEPHEAYEAALRQEDPTNPYFGLSVEKTAQEWELERSTLKQIVQQKLQQNQLTAKQADEYAKQLAAMKANIERMKIEEKKKAQKEADAAKGQGK